MYLASELKGSLRACRALLAVKHETLSSTLFIILCGIALVPKCKTHIYLKCYFYSFIPGDADSIGLECRSLNGVETTLV